MLTPAQLEERARATTRPFRHLYPYAPHFLEVDGRAMHYVDEGPRDCGTVLCVHGNPTWSFYWRAVIEALAPMSRVVAVDHLGMGLSDRVPGGLRLADHVRALVALIDQLDLRDITLVVHDWGGAIGFGAALERTERIARLVVTNTSAFTVDLMPKCIAACRVPLLGRLAVQAGNAFALAATKTTTTKPLARDVRRGLLAPYRSWTNREQIWRFVADIPMDASHPTWATVGEIAGGLATLGDRPMHIVWGMRDWCFSPAFLTGWEERFPDATVTRLEDAAHYVVEDAPEAVIDAIREGLAP